jgi:hypothetical protein
VRDPVGGVLRGVVVLPRHVLRWRRRQPLAAAAAARAGGRGGRVDRGRDGIDDGGERLERLTPRAHAGVRHRLLAAVGHERVGGVGPQPQPQRAACEQALQQRRARVAAAAGAAGGPRHAAKGVHQQHLLVAGAKLVGDRRRTAEGALHLARLGRPLLLPVQGLGLLPLQLPGLLLAQRAAAAAAVVVQQVGQLRLGRRERRRLGLALRALRLGLRRQPRREARHELSLRRCARRRGQDDAREARVGLAWGVEGRAA